MPDIKTPSWHVNGYQSLAPTPTTMHWFWQGSSPTWTTLRFCVTMHSVEHMPKYTSTFSLLLLVLTFILNLVTLGNDFTDFLWSCGNTVKTHATIIQPEIMDSIYVCINPPRTTNFWTYC